MTVIASWETPASSSVSSATWSMRFVTPPLKRETTTPTERRLPSGVPSSTVNPPATPISPRTCSTLASAGGSSITAADSAAGQPSNGSPRRASVSSVTTGSGSGSGGGSGAAGRAGSTRGGGPVTGGAVVGGGPVTGGGALTGGTSGSSSLSLTLAPVRSRGSSGLDGADGVRAYPAWWRGTASSRRWDRPRSAPAPRR